MFFGLLRKWLYSDTSETTVELRCPLTQRAIATEKTEPVHRKLGVEGGTCISTYRCSATACDEELHSFLWGPPTPLIVETPAEAKDAD